MTLPTAGHEGLTHGGFATPEKLANQIRAVWHESGLTWKPTARWFPRMPAHLDEIFGLLFDMDADGHVDAILFADERRSSPLHNIRDFVGSLQSPLIDLKGRAGDFADAHFDLQEPRTWTETARRILKFRQQRDALPLQFRNSVDPEIQLLSHLYVSNKELRGMRYPLAPEAICYPGFYSAAKTVPLAESLALRGFLKKRFFDRLHECSNCQSRRLSVREECPSCRSADLHESSLIHHFHCASVLPEEQFRRGTALVCPKCQRQLRNYGKDYDRPGEAYTCNTCETTSSEVEVGFVCFDCNCRIDGEAIRQVDLYSYLLSDAGVAFLEGDPSAITSSLPVSLQREIDRIDATANANAVLAEIRFANGEELITLNGRPSFDKSRDLFFETLRNRLGVAASLFVDGDMAYLLAERFDMDFERELRDAVTRSGEILRLKLSPVLTVKQRLGRA
ncbi:MULTISPECIES: hypothetical protein [Brucella/Ochrobactrum group]|uniref:TackOD1 domain-containing metal-binding protein n=1 Tax=Brucella/Ochrobactrum group TaxID=2826938 RepID=UPI00112253C1|nr:MULTISPECIES: hypothetical protein [Brucella/Ochrobactrum group]